MINRVCLRIAINVNKVLPTPPIFTLGQSTVKTIKIIRADEKLNRLDINVSRSDFDVHDHCDPPCRIKAVNKTHTGHIQRRTQRTTTELKMKVANEVKVTSVSICVHQGVK